MRIIHLIASNLVVLILLRTVSTTIRDTSRIFTARQKRYLIFEEGVNWIQMVVGVGFPIEVRQESITWGVTMYSYYLLPTNSSEVLHPNIDILRKKRTPSRWEIYSAISNFMDRFNLGNGKVCLMRAVCEAAFANFEEKSGLLAEIMHVVLTPSTTNEEIDHYTDFEYHAAEKLGKTENNCAKLFSECNFYFLEKLTRILL